jgi:kynurenine formamidase
VAEVNVTDGVAVDFTAATSLARTLDFAAPNPRHFGAPPAHSAPFAAGSFNGEVARGASCNCRSVTLIPHCNGTHTESASHLTIEQRPLHEILPMAPLAALLLTVAPVVAAGCGEDTVPAPQAGDRLITRAAVVAAWDRYAQARPRALLLRTGTGWRDTAPPFLSRQLALELVSRGVEHLVIDLPSVDRAEDQGRLTVHRVFFGLPADSTHLADAQRPFATITEFACFPAALADGPCAVQLQIPDWSGDAVPSRPLHLPLAAS